ncbi:MAG: hypothetical protein M3126_00900 [Candidatus Eremiobacteraeota bacterium]|nr:hypothetical protein [Candidatus Eremiobacteraeota bacterium]
MRSLFIALAFILLGATAPTPSPSPSPSPSPTPVPSPLAQLSFRNVGPATAGGRISSAVGSERDSALYYIGSAGGGVWKTTNAGVDWTPVFDDQKIASIGAVAIDPASDAVVWAGTGESNPRNDVSPGGGIFKSTDAGKSWKLMGLAGTRHIGKISIDPRDSKSVVVSALGDPFADSTERGIYRTTDGGTTWSKALYLGPASGGSDIARAQKEPGLMLAGMWQFRRTGWSSQSGGDQDGLFRSRDGGATWERLSGHGLPTDTIGRIAVAIAPSNPRRMYATIQSKQGILWRSDDGGDSWQLISNDTWINERPFYFSELAVDPTNADHLFSESVRLNESNDAGKTWHRRDKRMHGDHHGLWIASDGKRIIEMNDGGPAFSLDGAATWNMRDNVPIGQLYHIGWDRGNPYRICAPLQDNGGWCGPSNSLQGSIPSAAWEYAGGGDAIYVQPDPNDRRNVWVTSAGSNNAGDTTVFNEDTKQTAEVSPVLRDQNVVPPSQLPYRLNWETPLAFDPFTRNLVYVGGNVIFATRDRGHSWKVISPDLSRNEKSHQKMTGGVTLDGTGAETADTILYIEPSRVSRGEIWTGSDDGVMYLTRDGGKHWQNVTPAGIVPFGRFGSISASVRSAGTAYAIYDAHMTGDKTPYAYKTTDFGKTWTRITSGLPAGQYVRTIREDPKNTNVVYLGTEFGLFASTDRGGHWQPFQQNLPPASVRDIQIQPDFNDLLVATHGRDAWILDDLTPFQQLQRARSATAHVFPVRRAYLYEIHGGNSSSTFLGAGDDPSYGAIITFYLKTPAKANPTAEILDSRGRVVRRFTTHLEDGKSVPDMSNQAGLNRFNWDLTEDKPVPWNDAPDWNQFNSGPVVVPGHYTVVVHAGANALRSGIEVATDPRERGLGMNHPARYALEHRLATSWSRIDRALNTLTAVQTQADARKTALAKTSPSDPMLAQLDSVKARAAALQATITSNPRADQDNDFLRDILRERVQSLLFTFDTFRAPTQEQVRETHVVEALEADRLHAVDLFVNSDVRAINAALRKKQLAPIT